VSNQPAFVHVKRMEIECMRMLEILRAHSADPAWLAIAKTHFEHGFTAAGRAVSRPTN